MNNIVSKLFFLMLLSLPTALQAAGSYSHLYVFGDSLSDNGNFITLAGLPSEFMLPPPYSGNRLSNGPLAVENLAALIGTTVEPYYTNPSFGTNFAISGARAGGDSARDFTAQVDTFLASQNNKAPKDALYIVFFGGNDMRDIRNALLDNLPRQERVAIYSQALAAMESNIRNLVEHGARNLLVVYAPDISRVPESISLADSHPKILRQMQKRTTLFNRNLKHMLEHLRFEYNEINATGIKLTEFNLPEHSKVVIDNAQAYNFDADAVNESCLTMDYDTLQVLETNPQCGTNLELVDNFIYIDQLHLTASRSERLGRALYNVIPAP